MFSGVKLSVRSSFVISESFLEKKGKIVRTDLYIDNYKTLEKVTWRIFRKFLASFREILIKAYVELLKMQSSQVFLLPYLTKYLFEITQTLTQKAKCTKKDVCLVCFLNFFDMNVKQQLLLGSKFCDAEMR